MVDPADHSTDERGHEATERQPDAVDATPNDVASVVGGDGDAAEHGGGPSSCRPAHTV